MLLAEVSPTDLRAVMRKLLTLAGQGNLVASELVLRYALGGPLRAVDPDRLDEHELEVRKHRPTLVDCVALSDEQADRLPAVDPEDDPEDGPAPEALDEEPPDRPSPSLQALVTWVVREVVAAQTPPAGLPSNALAGFETFAASRLEFDPEAAVDVDRLYLTYARHCQSHGEPLLDEEKALAWLQDHGASLRAGALGQPTMLVGVRVVA